MLGGGPACPIRNTEGLVSPDQQRASAKARAIAIWFARLQAGMKLEQVREQLQARSYPAVAMQVGRLQRQLSYENDSTQLRDT